MNWFKLPKYICKDFDKLNKDFFWNNNKADNQDNHDLIKSIARDKICRPKM